MAPQCTAEAAPLPRDAAAVDAFLALPAAEDAVGKGCGWRLLATAWGCVQLLARDSSESGDDLEAAKVMLALAARDGGGADGSGGAIRGEQAASGGLSARPALVRALGRVAGAVAGTAWVAPGGKGCDLVDGRGAHALAAAAAVAGGAGAGAAALGLDAAATERAEAAWAYLCGRAT